MMDRLLEKDITLRVLAVFIALMLWFVAANERNPVTTAEVRGVGIAIENVAAGCAVASSDLKAVDVTVRGRRDIVQRTSRADFVATVDLGGLGSGQHAVAVAIVAPIGVEVQGVTPAQVTVYVDSVVRRQIPVTVACLGRPARDYRVASASVTPTDITVEGPARVVERAARARASVDVAGLTSDVSRTVPVQVLDENNQELKGLRCQPESVQAAVTVTALPPARVLEIVVSTSGEPAAGYRLVEVTVDPPQVEVWGPLQVVGGLDHLDVGPLTIAGATGDVSTRLTLEPPEGVTALDPSEVVVTARIEREAERRLEGVQVQARNVPAGLVLAGPLTVNVVVVGPRSLIDALRIEDITATVDLAGLGAGEQQLVVSLEGPAGVEARGDPPRVTVTLVPSG
jgi:YbbR domain-containing protein